ncbi:CGNR zinc finger domain-containing protein [Streptomyces sioyaensis]|uniref:CGNR zinc finger domain-containing protein n=1 Tax=Streptomyces sioyaensis TaxID=67364 RepID=UPI00371F7854
MPATDPRPLTGEPVALDLLNTRWMHDGVRQDLLTGTEGLHIWLTSNGLDRRFPADAAGLEHALVAREALASALADPGDSAAIEQVDAVLGHGRIRATLTTEGPGEEPQFEDPSWGAAWIAAHNYLDLLRAAPDRIRSCAHEACILHFFDTSRNGTRRWCSMAACGNRAKASRHYAKTHDS